MAEELELEGGPGGDGDRLARNGPRRIVSEPLGRRSSLVATLIALVVDPFVRAKVVFLGRKFRQRACAPSAVRWPRFLADDIEILSSMALEGQGKMPV